MDSNFKLIFSSAPSVCSFCLNCCPLYLLTLFIQNRLPYASCSPNPLPVDSTYPVDYDGPSQALFPGSALVIKCRSLRLLAQHSTKHKSDLTWLSILSILADSLTHRESLVSKLQCCLGSLSLASFPGAFCDPKMSNKSSRRKCFIGFKFWLCPGAS